MTDRANPIEDLKRATEGSRELDQEIRLHFVAKALETSDDGAKVRREMGGWCLDDPDANVPHYTTNLQDVRDACDWVLVHASDIGADGLALVRLGNPANSKVVEGIHNNLILAWCIAVLKAKETENG